MNKCDSDSKEWCFLLKWIVPKKMCETNKNVTNMGVIIKGVWCIYLTNLKFVGQRMYAIKFLIASSCN